MTTSRIEKTNGAPAKRKSADCLSALCCERCQLIEQTEAYQFPGYAAARLCMPCRNAVTRKLTGTASYRNAVATKAELHVLESLAASGKDTREAARELAAKIWGYERSMFQTVMRAVASGAVGDGESEEGEDGERERAREPAAVGS